MKNAVVNFLFEAGILSKTPRSGFYLLGSGPQSVAEHINRTAYVGYVLAHMEGDVDTEKVLKMCLFHDFAEARTSDLAYVHQKYVTSDEDKAIDELTQPLPFGNEMRDIIGEYEERESKEAILVKDADLIELLLSLKEQHDIGNPRAQTWMNNATGQLQTDSAKELAVRIQSTPSDDWWYADKNDPWWMKQHKKRKSS